MKTFRRVSLTVAESVDAWRVVPRAVLVLYAYLVLQLYLWFKNIPTYVQEKCDEAVLKLLLTSAAIDVEEARRLACTVVDVVGGPTASQSTFVTVIVGLSTGIFGLYTATGRNWETGLPKELLEQLDHLKKLEKEQAVETPPTPPPIGPVASDVGKSSGDSL